MTRRAYQMAFPSAATRATRGIALAAVILLAAPVASHALPSISAKRFESATSCVCHGELQDQWAGSLHAKAIFDPVYLVDRAHAIADEGAEIGIFCDTCHTPVGTMAGQTASGKKLGTVAKEGVTCDFCHQVTGTGHPIGGASQKLRANGTKRAQLKRTQSPTHDTAFSAFHMTAEFCGACHSLKHPVTGATLDSTYEEWAAGPYAASGVVCQDCHMSQGPGAGPVTGLAASFAPIRSDIYLMNFVGANVALGDSLRAAANLRAAAELEIDAPEVVNEGSSRQVVVTVTNVGAGHGIPGGAADVREMWLEVSAVSADGTRRTLARRDFGRVLKDSKGRFPVPVWKAAGIQSEDRIGPGESVDITSELDMSSPGKVTVEAVLYYRSFPVELAMQAGVRNPVTQMAKAGTEVFGSEAARRAAMERGGVPTVLLVTGGALVFAALAGTGALVFRRRSRRKVDAFGRAVGSSRDRHLRRRV